MGLLPSPTGKGSDDVGLVVGQAAMTAAAEIAHHAHVLDST